MLGPALFLATSPDRTYTPAPRVLPTPRATRSKVVRHRLKVDFSPSGSSGFLRETLTRKDFNSDMLCGRGTDRCVAVGRLEGATCCNEEKEEKKEGGQEK